MARKKIISLAMATLMTVSSLGDVSPVFYESIIANAKTEEQNAEETEQEVVAEAEQVNADYPLCEKSQDGVILHAFCWSFNTIK